jgi:uncharacterized protein (DUF1697 family)
MAVYVAFLRGINVGARNRIKMDDLRKTFLALGFVDVQTYIQSGNVLFSTTPDDEPALHAKIEQAIAATFAIQTSVILRMPGELADIASHQPFPAEMIAEAEAAAGFECLHVALFSQPPTLKEMDRLAGLKSDGETFHLVGRNLYLFLPHGVHASKLAGGLAKLSTPVSSRNWKTMAYLTQAAEKMQAGAL